MKTQKLNEIMTLLNQQGSITVPELSNYLHVSTKTVRRYLETLENMGKLIRTYGGAELIATDVLREKPFELRIKIESEKKDRIGKISSDLIENGQKIFIAAGSTLYYLNKYIDNQKKLFVVTDSVSVVNQLNSRSNIELFILGGQIKKHTLSSSDSETEKHLMQYHFDTAFVSASCIDENGCLYHRGNAEYGVYRHLKERSKKIVALMDSTKIFNTSFLKVLTLQPGDIVVSDDELEQEKIHILEDKGLQVVIAK